MYIMYLVQQIIQIEDLMEIQTQIEICQHTVIAQKFLYLLEI